MKLFNYAYEFAEMPLTQARRTVKDLTNGRRRSYREFEYGKDRNQRVLWYEPEKVLHDAVILYFHGGGYLVGSPDSMGVAADEFGAEGYRFFSIGYRLLSSAPFPAQVEDAFRGYAVVMKLLEMEGLEGSPVIVCGNSAGGQLAALLAYGKELREGYGVDTGAIRGVLSVAGVLDSKRVFGGKTGVIKQKFTRITSPAAMKKYSPIDVLDQYSRAGFLGIYGKYDQLSPESDAQKFTRILNAFDLERRERESEVSVQGRNGDEEPQRFKTEGGGSKPAAKYEGWENMSVIEEEPLAQLHTLRSWKYQHVRLTAGLFTENQKNSRLHRLIFRWLEKFDGISVDVTPDPDLPVKAVLTRDTLEEFPDPEDFSQEFEGDEGSPEETRKESAEDFVPNNMTDGQTSDMIGVEDDDRALVREPDLIVDGDESEDKVTAPAGPSDRRTPSYGLEPIAESLSEPVDQMPERPKGQVSFGLADDDVIVKKPGVSYGLEPAMESNPAHAPEMENRGAETEGGVAEESFAGLDRKTRRITKEEK